VYTTNVRYQQVKQMIDINAKEARQHFSLLLDRVANGESISITRHGRKVATLIPETTQAKGGQLPSLKKFRQSMKVKGKPLSEIVISERNKERY